MISSLFLPDKIGSYYLLPKRIIGFDLSKTYAYASQLYLSGNSIKLEKFFQEPLDMDMAKPYGVRVSEAIRTIMSQVNSYHEIRSSLSSSLVIFKELSLPFTETEKISMILPYEVEPFLPFPIHECTLDFIITHINEEEKQAHILVAAVQKKYVQEQLNYFANVGYNPAKISIDIFDLYGLYKYLKINAKNEETAVLIDIEYSSTRLAFILKGQLKLIRTLPKGLAFTAKNLAHSLNLSNGQALEMLIRFGLEKHDDLNYTTLVSSSMVTFFQDIKFSLQSFIGQTKTDEEINTILLLGPGSEIPGIDNFATKSLQIPVRYFDMNGLLKMPSISMKESTRIPRANIMSLSTAFPSPLNQHLNMRKGEFALSTSRSFNKQFLIASTLLCMLLFSLSSFFYIEKKSLTSKVKAMEQEVITKLRKVDLTNARQFNKAIREAEDKVKQEEELWFSFSRQRRFSFLKALQDLSTSIDRQSVGLDLKKLVITTNDITIEGEVKKVDELSILERELKESGLFIYVPSLQKTTIKETLPLKKTGELA